MSKELTRDEVRQRFIVSIRDCILYWSEQEETDLHKLEGLAFSILVILDGGTGLPGFIVAPNPHPDDKEFLTSSGEDFFSENYESDIKCDIAGGLHELLFARS